LSANSLPPEPGEIITFYSYKGGTGRSMALANIACLLAQSKEGYGGVLMVDWDLEAPGLHRYFADRFQRKFPPSSPALSLELHPGLIDLFERFRDEIATLPSTAEEPTPEMQEHLRASIALDRFVISTDVPNLSILKAGCFDENYARRVNTFPWEPLYKQAPWLIPFFADWLTSRFRYILIDSRTGITDTSGICTMLLPDKLVVVFTPNQQSLDGVLEMTERATNYRRRSSDMRPLSVFPLASRIESSEPDLRTKWRKAEGFGYQPRFEVLFKKVWELDDCNLESYLNEVQIQHASAYAYGERIAVLAETSDDRTSLRRAFASFAERLVTLDEPWDSAPPKPASTTTGLTDAAESFYAQLPPDRQETAHRLFLQLIRLPSDVARPIAREVNLAVLSKEQQELIPPLTAAKLVMTRANAVCLADETLITDWRRLDEWIAGDARFLNWRDTLDSAQTSWEKHNQSKELLLRGKPLEEAIGNLTRSNDLNSSEMLYIGYAIVARDRRKRVVWISAAAAVCAIALAFYAVTRFASSSSQAQAEAILGQNGLDAAIRAERVAPNSPKVDAALRTLLGQTPEPVLLFSNSQSPDQIVFSPDETFLAVYYRGKGIWYRDLSAGGHDSQSIETWNGYRGDLALAVSPGKKFTAAVATDTGGVFISNASSSQPVVLAPNAAGTRAPSPSRIKARNSLNANSSALRQVASRITSLAFSPDGSALAAASTDGTVRLWSTAGKLLASMEHPDPVRQVLYSPDGQYLSTSDDQAVLRIWRAQDGAPVGNFRSSGDITGSCFFPAGNKLAVGQGKQIAILSLPGVTQDSPLSAAAPVQSLACSASNSVWVLFPNATCQRIGLDGAGQKWIPYAQAGAPAVLSPKGSYFATVVLNGAFLLISRPDPEHAAQYAKLSGAALADAACQKLRMIAQVVPNYSKACPGK
jgi:WD40 repeat protein